MKKIIIIGLCMFFCINIFAQLSKGGLPLSFTSKEVKNNNIPVIVMPSIDIDQYKREDEFNKDKVMPFRFGAEIPVSIGFESGIWTLLSDGSKLWQVSISSEKALSINLIFDKYILPKGSSLFIYNKNRDVIGAFTENNNNDNGVFATDLISGNFITLEYHEPKLVEFTAQIRLKTVVHGYREFIKIFGDSGNCNINVNCPTGVDWN
jgi:hypothetical protein